MEGYVFLLEKISDNLINTNEGRFIKKNIKPIATNLKNLSNMFNELISMTLDTFDSNTQVKKINDLCHTNNINLEDDQPDKIVNAMYVQKGGENQQGFISQFITQLTSLYKFDITHFKDFNKDLDWIFILLFVLASIPFVGQVVDIVIFVRAVLQERHFLAILTLITSLTSLLVLRTIDLGAIIKLLYTMDVFSYNGSKNIFVPKEGNPVVFYDKKNVDAAIGKVTEISENIASTTQKLGTNMNSYLNKVENAYEMAKTMVPESTIPLETRQSIEKFNRDNNKVNVGKEIKEEKNRTVDRDEKETIIDKKSIMEKYKRNEDDELLEIDIKKPNINNNKSNSVGVVERNKDYPLNYYLRR